MRISHTFRYAPPWWHGGEKRLRARLARAALDSALPRLCGVVVVSESAAGFSIEVELEGVHAAEVGTRLERIAMVVRRAVDGLPDAAGMREMLKG